MEFQWLMQDAGAGATEGLRDAMEDLLEAAVPPGEAARAMALRIEAKAAASLLRAARFGPDRDRAEWAGRRAADLLAMCGDLMVS